MKVAIFSEYYHPHLGGLEMRAKGIAEELVRAGHSVAVFTVGYEEDLPEREIVNGVVVHRHHAWHYGRPGVKFVRRGLRAMLSYALWCRSQARGDFDLLFYTEFPVVHAVMAPALARRKAIMDWCEFRRDNVFKTIQKWAPKLFRWNTCVAEEVGKGMQNSSGRNFYCLPSGINVDHFRSEEQDRQHLIYIGRLQPHKNLPFLISCFEEFCSRGHRDKLYLIGGGAEEASLRERCKESPWRDLIVMTGTITDQEKIAFLSKAKAMVLVSMREGFPVSIAEALASGLPTVTIDLPENGASSVVRQYRCGLVAEPNPVAVADALEAVLAERRMYSTACLEAARGLDWSFVVRSLLNYLAGTSEVFAAAALNEEPVKQMGP